MGSKIHQYDAYNYEQILRADHGRCLGYELTKNGTAKAMLDTEHDDAAIFEKYVRKLQSDILTKFDKIAELNLANNSNIDSIATIYYFKTIKNKTNADFKWILDMQDCHHDDFGYVLPWQSFRPKTQKICLQNQRQLFHPH